MSTRCCLLALALLGLGTLLAPTAHGQSVRLIRQVIGSGATVSNSAQHLVLGTVGQTIIGRSTSSSGVGALGFWYTYPHAYTTGVREEYVVQLTGAAGAVRVAPNPASDEARVTISLTVASTVSLKLYDALGRERLTLIDGRREAGMTTLQLPVRDLASGDYTVVLTAAGVRSIAPLRVIN